MESPSTTVLAQPAFGADRTARLCEMEGDHFWFVGRRALVEQLLDRHVKPGGILLDVGCGTGSLSQRLNSRHRVVALDVSAAGFTSNEARPSALRVQADGRRLPVAPNSMHTAVALDVLEHTDDRALLVALHDALAPDGVVVLTVPALPWLWSHRDVAAGHLRRYTRRALIRLVREIGFEVLEVRSYQFLLLPLIAIARWAGRSGPAVRDLEDRPAGVINRILTRVSLLDVHVGSVAPWPTGSSIAIACRKT